MKFSIYMAGKVPKGEEEEGFQDWRKEFAETLKAKSKDIPGTSKIVFLDPNTFSMDGLDNVEDFFGRDVHMIAICSAVLVDAREKIGAGTAQEMLIAKYFRKPVVSVIPKDSHYRRRILYKGRTIDYRHPFIFSSSDAVVESFGEAADWLIRLFSGRFKHEIKSIDLIEKSEKDYLERHSHNDKDLNKWKKEMEHG